MTTTKDNIAGGFLATGGGNATASGVTFQGAVSTTIAVAMINKTPLDSRLGLGAAKPVLIGLESDAPVDDILVETDLGGWVFFQAKNSLRNQTALTSELGKTCDEFARLWHLTQTGTGARAWDRPLVEGRDAMVVAVGPGASRTIKADLARALDAFRSGATATLSHAQRNAIDSLRALLAAALRARGGTLASVNPDQILQFIHVLDFDFGGPHRSASEAALAASLEQPVLAPAAFMALERACQNLMTARGRGNGKRFRAHLAAAGTALKAPPEYRADFQALRSYVGTVERALGDYQKTTVNGTDVTIERACTSAVVSAALSGSLVVVGDPGSGKSAVINNAAQKMRDAGHEVVLLAVDRLQVETVEGLAGILGVKNSLLDVMENWPGTGSAFLFLDALDACRFGKSETLFRNFMHDVLNLPSGRWRVIASIRTFDLVVGLEFGRLFRGVPPDRAFLDQRFQSVRHIRISDWSDDEFADLLTKIPDLKTAISTGGAKLAELARVPFNTRLLAELLSLGVVPSAFKYLNSQVQLLEMYWNERVRPLGAPAVQCLKNTVSAMIGRSRMEAQATDAGAGTGTALDELLRRGVLIPLNGGREVAFRHHILFDYVASRVLIDLDDLATTSTVLSQGGAGLLLAPALSFALQNIWEIAGADRMRFWTAAVHLIGSENADPVARSVAARASCDLAETPQDMSGLLTLLQGRNAEIALKAFRHVIGSLSVRLEDDLKAPAAPWCFLASQVVPVVDKLAWPLRQLIFNLIDRVSDKSLVAQLGLASRALMDHALLSDEHLMSLAISFVGKTFATDPASSRDLVLRVLEPERMKKHAPSEMNWLAQETGRIGAVAPDLVVTIYRSIFAHKITDDGKTNLGNSQILGLTSNRKQDFEGSRWSLKEAFPAFSESHPIEGADVALKVAEAYSEEEHGLTERSEEAVIRIGNESVTLKEDLSHIWASEHGGEYADNAQQLVDAFINRLRSASEADALMIIDHLIGSNKLGWIWTRLFMVAAERGGAIGARLWPFAADLAFQRSLDTTKDALDLVATGYQTRSPDEREAFERKTLQASFPKSQDPDKAVEYFRRKVFSTIGDSMLVTAEAKQVLEAARASGKTVSNVRPYRISGAEWISDDRGDFDWLKDNGANIDAPQNAHVLQFAAASDTASESRSGFTNTTDVESLRASLGAASLDPQVRAYGYERLASALASATNVRKDLEALTAETRALFKQILTEVLQEASPEKVEEQKAYGRALKYVAAALLNLSRVDKELVIRYRDTIEALASEDLADVREEVARRIGHLWEADRELLWKLAEQFARTEKNGLVLFGLLNFLIRAANGAPERVGAIVQTLLGRQDLGDDDGHKVFREGLGTLVFHLWVQHRQEAARKSLDCWLADRSAYKVELQHGVFSIRQGLVVGYENDDPVEAAMRVNTQALALEIIDATASGIESFMTLKDEGEIKKRQEAASEDARLLDQMSSQFLYALGATEIRKGSEPKAVGEIDQQRRYLADNEATFRRIGDIGTPHTIYYLLQLLEFLMPSDPAKVFGLVAHALLKAGKVHNYQAESLGADQFVRVIGTTIADHRDLFDEPAVRTVLVDVLEVFVNAGWPAARRLLYRLPEALR